jgi:hypothetical protein
MGAAANKLHQVFLPFKARAMIARTLNGESSFLMCE